MSSPDHDGPREETTKENVPEEKSSETSPSSPVTQDVQENEKSKSGPSSSSMPSSPSGGEPSKDQHEDVSSEASSPNGTKQQRKGVSFNNNIAVKEIPAENATATRKRRSSTDVADGDGGESSPKSPKFFSHTLEAVPKDTVSGQPYYVSVFETRESSISFKECKTVLKEYIDFCVALNKKRTRQQSGDEIPNKDNGVIDVYESFTRNSTLQDLADLPLSDWGSASSWEQRKQAVRDFATFAVQKASTLGSAHLNHPGVKGVGSFTRLSTTGGSYGSMQEGTFIHVWRSCAQAKRFALSFQRISQAIFDGFCSTVAAPIVNLVSFRGSTILVMPCVPLTESEPVTVKPANFPMMSHYAQQLAHAIDVNNYETMKLFRGSDGRTYFLDLDCPLPHTFSAPAGDGATHARLEAYSVMPSPSIAAEQHIRHTEVVKSTILNSLVPLAAESLLAEIRTKKLDANTAIRKGICAEIFHKVGVNMRFLYFVLTTEAMLLDASSSATLAQSQTASNNDDDNDANKSGDDDSDELLKYIAIARDILNAEMVIRSIKDTIRSDLSTQKGEKEEVSVGKVNRVLQSVMSKKSGHWDTNIMPILRQKFTAPDSFSVPLSPSLIKQVTARLQTKLGFIYKAEESRFSGFKGAPLCCTLFQVPQIARFIIYGEGAAASGEGGGPSEVVELEAKRVASMKQLSRRRSSLGGMTLDMSQQDSFAASPVKGLSGNYDAEFSLQRTSSFLSRKDIAVGMLAMEEPWREELETSDTASFSSGGGPFKSPNDNDAAFGPSVSVSNLASPTAGEEKGSQHYVATLHGIIYSLHKRIVIATVIQEVPLLQEACKELHELLTNSHPVQRREQSERKASNTAAMKKVKFSVVKESTTFAGASAILFDVDRHGRSLIGNEHHNVLRTVCTLAVDNWYVAERIRYLGQAMNDPGVMVDSFKFGKKAFWVDPTLRPKYFWFLLEATKGLNVGDHSHDLKELLVLAVKYCSRNEEMRKTLVFQCRKITSALLASQDPECCGDLADISVSSLVLHEKVFGPGSAQTGIAIVHMVDVALHKHLNRLSGGNARELKKFHNIALSLGAKTEDEMVETLRSEKFLSLLGTMVSALLAHKEERAAQMAMQHALAFSDGKELTQSVATSQAELQARAINLILKMVRRRRKKTEWTADRIVDSESSHRRGLEILWFEEHLKLYFALEELLELHQRKEIEKVERIVRRRMDDVLWRERYELRRLGRLQEKYVENIERKENKMRVAREDAARRDQEKAIRRQELLKLDVDAQISEVSRMLVQKRNTGSEEQSPLLLSSPVSASTSPAPTVGSPTQHMSLAEEQRLRFLITKHEKERRKAEEEARAKELQARSVEKMMALVQQKEFNKKRDAIQRDAASQHKKIIDAQRKTWLQLMGTISTKLNHLGMVRTKQSLEQRERENAEKQLQERLRIEALRTNRKDKQYFAKQQAALRKAELERRDEVDRAERTSRTALRTVHSDIQRLLMAEEYSSRRNRTNSFSRMLQENPANRHDDDSERQQLAALRRKHEKEQSALVNDEAAWRRSLLLEANAMRRGIVHSFQQGLGVLQTQFVTEKHRQRMAEIDQERDAKAQEWKVSRLKAEQTKKLRQQLKNVEAKEVEHRRLLSATQREEFIEIRSRHQAFLNKKTGGRRSSTTTAHAKRITASKEEAAAEAIAHRKEKVHHQRRMMQQLEESSGRSAIQDAERDRFLALMKLFVHQRRAIVQQLEQREADERRRARADMTKEQREQEAALRKRLDTLQNREGRARRTLMEMAIDLNPASWLRKFTHPGETPDFNTCFDSMLNGVCGKEELARAGLEAQAEHKLRELLLDFRQHVLGDDVAIKRHVHAHAVAKNRAYEKELQREQELAAAVAKAQAEYLALREGTSTGAGNDEDATATPNGDQAAATALASSPLTTSTTSRRVKGLLERKRALATSTTSSPQGRGSVRRRDRSPQPAATAAKGKELTEHASLRWLVYKCSLVEKSEVEWRHKIANAEAKQFDILHATIRRDLGVSENVEVQRKLREQRHERQRMKQEAEQRKVDIMLARAKKQLDEARAARAAHDHERRDEAIPTAEGPESVTVVDGEVQAATDGDADEYTDIVAKPSPYVLMFYKKKILADQVRKDMERAQQEQQAAATKSQQVDAFADGFHAPPKVVVTKEQLEHQKQEAARIQRAELNAALEERRAKDTIHRAKRHNKVENPSPVGGSHSKKNREAIEAAQSQDRILRAQMELEELRQDTETKRRDRDGETAGKKKQTTNVVGGFLPKSKTTSRVETQLAKAKQAREQADAATKRATSTSPSPHKRSDQGLPAALVGSQPQLDQWWTKERRAVEDEAANAIKALQHQQLEARIKLSKQHKSQREKLHQQQLQRHQRQAQEEAQRAKEDKHNLQLIKMIVSAEADARAVYEHEYNRFVVDTEHTMRYNNGEEQTMSPSRALAKSAVLLPSTTLTRKSTKTRRKGEAKVVISTTAKSVDVGNTTKARRHSTGAVVTELAQPNAPSSQSTNGAGGVRLQPLHRNRTEDHKLQKQAKIESVREYHKVAEEVQQSRQEELREKNQKLREERERKLRLKEMAERRKAEEEERKLAKLQAELQALQQ